MVGSRHARRNGGGSRLNALALPCLSGPTERFNRQALSALLTWAADRGVHLDVRSVTEAGPSANDVLAARSADVVFGPYGSGPMRTLAERFRFESTVVFNHGGAAIERTGGRIVDILGPAEAYWTGLADVLALDGVPIEAVAILHSAGGFGRAVARGATAALRRAGVEPILVRVFDEQTAAVAATAALRAGAKAVVGCGRPEEDLALGHALAGGPWLGLVVCGVELARERLGERVRGAVGPAQWDASHPPPIPLLPESDYPAAQALAAGLIAERVLADAGGSHPDRVWGAALALRTTTFFGAFAVDADGRQVAHAPVLVRWAGDPLRRHVIWRPAGTLPA